MRPGRLNATLALAAVLLLAVVSVLVYVQATGPRPVRILLVGDSVTQGSTGDWTWRFRLWEHLTASDVDVDLVGPRNDLLDRATYTFGSQEYADPHFDRDHAARWGMALAAMDQPIDGLVQRYRPDVVVEMLGLNDLTWLKDDPAEIEEELTAFVADARSENPAVDIVLGELPQVWSRGVPQLNARLPSLARSLDTSSSRVVVARPEGALVEGVDTYDPGAPGGHRRGEGGRRRRRRAGTPRHRHAVPATPPPGARGPPGDRLPACPPD